MGATQKFNVETCPASFYYSNGSCTCAAGQYELTGACVARADHHAKSSVGVEKSDCVACLAVIGETSNAAHTACDACVAGYYNKGKACVQCPNYPISCVDERSVLMSGYLSVPRKTAELNF